MNGADNANGAETNISAGGAAGANTANEEKLYGAEELAAAIRWNEAGLVPAIVQDAKTREVLMLAWMNREALARTLETGETWFWSRSRGKLWHKGETSGNVQKVRRLRYDCDADALLVEAAPAGAACHTGRTGCFYRELDMERGQSRFCEDLFHEEKEDPKAILDKLEALIAERERKRPEGSYTTYLFEKGLDKILKKSAKRRPKSSSRRKTAAGTNSGTKRRICCTICWCCCGSRGCGWTRCWRSWQAAI